jgi:hypothetical protein
MKFNNLYRLLSERLGVDQQADKYVDEVIEKMISAVEHEVEWRFRRVSDYQHTLYKMSMDVKPVQSSKTISIKVLSEFYFTEGPPTKAKCEDFNSNFGNINGVRFRFAHTGVPEGSTEEMMMVFGFDVDISVIKTKDELVSELKKTLVRSRSIIAHELTHTADIARRSRKINSRHSKEGMTWNGIGSTGTPEYNKRYEKMCRTLCELLYITKDVEAIVAANEVSAEIQSKKQSEFLTTSEFLALFNQTVYVKRLNKIKPIKAEYDSLKAESNQPDFDKMVGKDTCDLARWERELKLNWISMDNLVSKCNQLLKRLARIYDLFAPPNTKKY